MDRTTKILLALIAAGLWANALMPIVKVNSAFAQDASSYLRNIDLNIRGLTNGVCLNAKLC